MHPARVPRLGGVRIIFVLPSLEIGGAERQALVLARHLRDVERADVRLWGLGPTGGMTSRCDEAGVEWHNVPMPPPGARVQQIRALISFVRALRGAAPDVLLPYARVPNRLCGLFWRATGARLCVWNHRAGAIDPVPRWVDQLAARRTPVFVANSDHGAAYLANAYGLPLARIHVIRNGVQLGRPERSRAEWRRLIGVDDRALLACMVANLTANKDHVTVLRAWRQAVPRIAAGTRQAMLLLAGRLGETYAPIRDLARSLDLEPSVRFLGPVDDIAGLLHAVDIGVFASHMEGCPNGVLECMARGLPIIGTDIAGIREAVGPEGLPYLAAPEDDGRLAELLVCLSGDHERREQIGRANRLRIEQDFSPREMGERMARLCATHLART